MCNKFLWRFSRAANAFGRRETGSTSVEAAIWVPFFILFAFGIGQLGLILYGQGRVLRVAEEATRSLAVGEFATDIQAEDWIRAQLAQVSNNVQADAFLDPNGAVIRTVVRVPARDLGGFGIFSSLTGFDVVVRAQQVWEYRV
jgi:Flp pilus assembly protein TadG